MSRLTIQLSDSRTDFSPRETIHGQVSWQCDEAPKTAELRLFWSTTGRGNDDMDIVQVIPFPTPGPADSRPFSLTLPDAPYSFRGNLIFLTWTLELHLEPGNLSEGIDLVIAPNGGAITLQKVSAPSP